MFSAKFILVSTKIFFYFAIFIFGYFTFALNPLKSKDTSTSDAINRFWLKNVLWPIWPTDDFMFLALSVKFFFLFRTFRKCSSYGKFQFLTTTIFFYFPQLQTENEKLIVISLFL